MLSMNRQQSEALIALILGHAVPSYGFIFWMDNLLEDYSILRQKPISVIRGGTSLIEDASIAENIFIYKKHRNRSLTIPWHQVYRQTALQFQELGLNLQASSRIHDLSDNDRIIVELVRAYLSGDKLIIIDELPENTTTDERASMLRLLKNFAVNGITILIVDYSLARLQRFVEQFSILDHRYIQSLPQEKDWISHYLDALKLPAAETTNKPKEIAFEATEISIGSNLPPKSIQLFRGQLTEICDSGNGHNPLLLRHLFTGNDPAIQNKVRLLDVWVSRYLVDELSPLENLCLGLYPKLSKAGVISSRSMGFIRREFDHWYGNCAPLEKQHASDLNLKEKIAVLLFRFIIEGVQVVFCTDPRSWQDYNIFVYLITLLRRLVDEHMIAVCIMTSEHSENDSFFDRILYF